MKRLIKQTPFVGPVAQSVYRRLRSPWSRTSRQRQSSFVFERLALDAPEPAEFDRQTRQIVNCLNYTKTSGSAYSAHKYPAGYHTLQLNGLHLAGQRKPAERLSLVPFDFKGKTVLDIGCNQGGMLFAIADQIEWGVGVDYDYRMINACNRIRSHTRTSHLDFYVFNLDRDPLEVMEDLLPGTTVDVAFLLSVCKWVDNWRSVIGMTATVATRLLFESNGTDEQQAEQLECVRQHYRHVTQLSDQSNDDPRHKDRRLYLCGHSE